MKHPTPAEIKSAIMAAFIEDYRQHPQGGSVPFIPARAISLVEKAISEANAKSQEAAQ